MASLGNGFARITYTGVSGVHHAIVPLKLSGTPVPGTEPDLVQKDTTVIEASDGILDYLAAYTPFFPASVNFGLVEIYAVDSLTEERTFIWGFDANVLGTHASAPVQWSMFTLTFKTVGGSTAKVVGMESSFAVNVYDIPPFGGGTPMAGMQAYMVSGACVHIGRDDTYPFAAISFRTKTSDVLRKRQPAV